MLFVFGFCLVGWNGLFMAEAARAAGSENVGVATGGVLVFTFAGIVIGPAAFATVYKLAGSYALTYGIFALAPLIGVAALFLCCAAAEAEACRRNGAFPILPIQPGSTGVCMTRRAADLLVDCLAAHEVDRIFCVPGESYLAVLDALHDRNTIETVICRHEGGAGFMAVADAKVTGKPGIAFVSRGPGATNASIAVHVAEQDAVPLVLFVGQVPRNELGRRSFQEVDYAKTFSDMAKAVWTIEDASRIPEILARAFVVAQTPTPGPVVIVLPEDMLEDATGAAVIDPLPVPRAARPSAGDYRRRRPPHRAGRAAVAAGGRRPQLRCGAVRRSRQRRSRTVCRSS